jgi:hypothetical protein
MKLFLPSLLLLLISQITNAQVEWSFGANKNVYAGQMHQLQSGGWGMNTGVAVKPFRKVNLWLITDASLTAPASITKNVLLTSPEVSEHIQTDVNYHSSFLNGLMGLRFEFPVAKRWHPYVSTSALTFQKKTELSISDPSSIDGCEYLGDYTLNHTNQWAWGAGGGLKFRASGAIPEEGVGGIWFDFSVNYFRGSSMDNINLRSVEKLGYGEVLQPKDGSKPVEVPFRNLHDNSMHTHVAGYMENNPFRLLQFRLALVIESLPRSKRISLN